jgi:Cytochrome P450
MRVTSPMAYIFRVQERLYAEQTQKIMDGGDSDRSAHVTVFHEIWNDPNLPPQEKTISRLLSEADSIVGAGTLTTAHMLSLTVFFLLKDAEVHKKLHAELAAVIPEPNTQLDMATLEKLPYLTAVVNEGLRLSYGVMHRLSRVHPKSTLQYREWTIPPNTPVGMTPYFLHKDKVLFPNPRAFDPERWLKLDSAERERQTRYLFNFGKGSRQCVGMRLAYTEMYLTIAYFMHRLGDQIQLFDTEYERDVEYVHDYFIPQPRFQSQGVRIVKA